MKDTVIVTLFDTKIEVDVAYDGPTVDGWYETEIRSEGDLVSLLQGWTNAHYWKLMDEVDRRLRNG